MQSVMSYLNIAQLLPCERTAEVCQDLFGHRWADGLIAALLAMKQAAADARQRGQKHIAKTTLKPLLTDYDRWISKGLKNHPEVAKPAGKRGRTKQSKERNLMDSIKSAFAGKPVDFAPE